MAAAATMVDKSIAVSPPASEDYYTYFANVRCLANAGFITNAGRQAATT